MHKRPKQFCLPLQASYPYNFNLCVEDHENTNFQCRDEWVGEDGITRGWYTVLMPDAFLYNYTYIAHPVKGYQVHYMMHDHCSTLGLLVCYDKASPILYIPTSMLSRFRRIKVVHACSYLLSCAAGFHSIDIFLVQVIK